MKIVSVGNVMNCNEHFIQKKMSNEAMEKKSVIALKRLTFQAIFFSE